MQPQGHLWFIQNHFCIGRICINLPQGGDVIQYPEGAAMSGYDQVIVVNVQVMDRNGGQVQLERLPVAALIQ